VACKELAREAEADGGLAPFGGFDGKRGPAFAATKALSDFPE
jgi:hypothetical protein